MEYLFYINPCIYCNESNTDSKTLTNVVFQFKHAFVTNTSRFKYVEKRIHNKEI